VRGRCAPFSLEIHPKNPMHFNPSKKYDLTLIKKDNICSSKLMMRKKIPNSTNISILLLTHSPRSQKNKGKIK
jgi:hypothetical protein